MFVEFHVVGVYQQKPWKSVLSTIFKKMVKLLLDEDINPYYEIMVASISVSIFLYFQPLFREDDPNFAKKKISWVETTTLGLIFQGWYQKKGVIDLMNRNKSLLK